MEKTLPRNCMTTPTYINPTGKSNASTVINILWSDGVWSFGLNYLMS